MIINKKIVRTFKANRSRYIGLFLLVMLSCLSFTAFRHVAPSAMGSLLNFWDEANVESAHFTLHHPLDDISGLEKEFDIRLEENLYYDHTRGYTTLRIFGETENINKYGVVNGRRLQQPGEILIDRLYANKYGIEIGSDIEVEDRSYHIVGYMTRPDYIYTLRQPSDILPGAFGMGVISSDDFTVIENYQVTYSVIFQRDNLNEFRKHLNEQNTVLSWLDREDNPRIAAVEPDIRAKDTIGNFLPAFILVVTCMIIAVVLWRLLQTEFVQMGTLYALGYKKTDILRHYMVYPLVICLTGGVLGTLLGVRLAVPLVMVTDGLQYNLPSIELSYQPAIMAFSLLLPCVFLLPTTWYVVQKALGMSPMELMRGGGNKTEVGFLEKRLNLNRFKFNTKFRIRELVRNIPRAIAMIIGVTFASTLLLMGFVMNDSILEIIEVGYEDLYRYEYQYMFKGLQFDYTKGAERQTIISAEILTEDKKTLVTVYGVEPEGVLLNLADSWGNRINDRVSVTYPLAETLDLDPGDTIILQSKINNLQTELIVQEIAHTFLGFFIFIPLDMFNEIFGMPAGSYTMLLSDSALDLATEEVASVITKRELQEGFREMMGLLRAFITILGVISVIIGVIIIYILTSLLIEENRYNISLMKVLGYGKQQIFSLVLNINFVLVLIGFGLSVPLIRYITDVMFKEVTEEMSLMIPAVINSYSILMGLGIMIAAFWLSNLISRRKVWEISMADSLKNREE